MADFLSCNFDDFTTDRLDDAERKLKNNEVYQLECAVKETHTQQLKDSLNPEQAKFFNLLEADKLSIAATRERNAYLSGLADGLRLLATL